MILLLLTLVIAFILWSFIENHDGEKAKKEFCNMECKQNITSKYKFCC